MSWSVVFEIPEQSDLEDIHNLISAAGVVGNEDCLKERDLSVTAAGEAVHSLISGDVWVNGAFGRKASTSSYIVTLSGHCNPDNKPVEGMSNDFLNISIVQK